MGPVIEKLIAELEGRNCKPHKSGDGWQAHCPSHADNHASMSIAEGEDERALVKCHAGCKFEEILSALGWEKRDLFPTRERDSRAKIVSSYPYTDESGALLYEVVRYQPKDFKQRRPDGKGGWLWKLGDVHRVLYRLVDVRRAISQGKRIYLPEGEKDVENLRALGLIATTTAGGAKTPWNSAYTDQLRGATEVVLLADNDAPGMERVENAANSLLGAVKVVKTLLLPNLPAKGDVSDWLATGGTVEQLEAAADAAPRWRCPPPTSASAPTATVAPIEDEGKPENRKQADLLVDLARSSKAEFWHTPGCDEGYATFAVDGHRENWSLRSKLVRLWLRRLFYEKFGTSPAAQAVADAIEQLRTEAFFEGEEYEAHLRIAGDGANIYIDLADKHWQQVVIRPIGTWEIIAAADSPVRFRRTKGMLPLPAPVRGGDLAELRKFINLKRDEDWNVLVVFLLCCLRSGLPFWLLTLVGEQGSGKSTCAERIRSLIDPNKVPLRSGPRDERELAIAARNGWLICIDNLSGLNP